MSRTLDQLRDSIHAAIVEHRGRVGDRPAHRLDPEDVVGTVRHLLSTATRAVSVLLPRDPGIWPALTQAAQRGVHVRVLCPGGAPTADPQPHLRIRTTTMDCELTVLVDGSTALSQETAVTAAWVVRSHPVVRTMTGLYGTAWANARPRDARTVDVSSPYTEHLLRSLYSGLPDETAAAEIGLSVRTYRRHVAAVLRDMGVTSRFQAGVRAHEFGLLHG